MGDFNILSDFHPFAPFCLEQISLSYEIILFLDRASSLFVSTKIYTCKENFSFPLLVCEFWVESVF